MRRKILLLIIAGSTTLSVFAQTVGIDSTFGNNGEVVTDLYLLGYPYGKDVVLQSDGQIIIGGRNNDNPLFRLQRYGVAGDLDPTYQFNPISPIFFSYLYRIGLQGGNKTVLNYENTVYRFLHNGLIDSTFGTNGSVQLNVGASWNMGMYIQPDNQMLFYNSSYSQSDTASVFYMTRLTENGQVDSSFADNGNFWLNYGDDIDIPWDVEVDSDGHILMAGSSYAPGWRTLILKLTPEGKIDPAFGDNGHIYTGFKGTAELYGMAIQPDDKIVVTGYTHSNTDFEFYAARYNPDGTPDSTFGEQGVAYFPNMEGTDIIIRPDGKINICAFNFSSGSTTLIQLLDNGQVNPAFGDAGFFSIDLDPYDELHPRAMFYTDINTINISCEKHISVTPTSFYVRKALVRILTDLVLGTEMWSNNPESVIWAYPNPVADNIHLKFDLPEQVVPEVVLTDRGGKVVRSLLSDTAFDAGITELDLALPPGMPSGTYFLCLKAGGKTATIQLFKS